MRDRPAPHEHATPAREPAPTVPGAPRRVRSHELLRGGSELVIEHRGRDYRLRVTQNGKLILTA
jgi:hemin uptake protein HemP